MAVEESPKVDGALPTHLPTEALSAVSVNASEVAQTWLSNFATACQQNDVEGILDLFWEDGFWRDLLPLTWSYRSLGGKDGGKARIRKVLEERLEGAKFSNFVMDSSFPPNVQNPFPDLSFVMLMFTFDCKSGNGSGIARIIPKKDGTGWEAFTVSTILEGLHGVEEKLGPNRENAMHTDAFPASWPVYTPAPKLADWLESYAHSLELNIWTSTNVLSTSFDETEKIWTVEVESHGHKRTFKPKIVVWAAGIGGGGVLMPELPGMDDFEGKIVHSAGFGTGKDWISKKVVVVGACTSAHDICKDLVDQGAGSTTMIQRSPTYIMYELLLPSSLLTSSTQTQSNLYTGGPPVDLADRIGASFGNAVIKELHKRVAGYIAEADKDLLAGLHAKGFMTTQGEDGSGFLMLAWARAGGYYLDVGASQLIIDGKIKVKSGHGVNSFTKDKIEFDDGTTMEADLVVFATGYGDNRLAVRKAMGDQVADKLTPLWGLSRLPVAWLLGSDSSFSPHHRLQLFMPSTIETVELSRGEIYVLVPSDVGVDWTRTSGVDDSLHVTAKRILTGEPSGLMNRDGTPATGAQLQRFGNTVLASVYKVDEATRRQYEECTRGRDACSELLKTWWNVEYENTFPAPYNDSPKCIARGLEFRVLKYRNIQARKSDVEQEKQHAMQERSGIMMMMSKEEHSVASRLMLSSLDERQEYLHRTQSSSSKSLDPPGATGGTIASRPSTPTGDATSTGDAEVVSLPPAPTSFSPPSTPAPATRPGNLSAIGSVSLDSTLEPSVITLTPTPAPTSTSVTPPPPSTPLPASKLEHVLQLTTKIEALRHQSARLGAKLHAQEVYFGAVEDAERLQRLFYIEGMPSRGGRGGQEFFLVLLSFEEEDVAIPWHIISHPRPTREDLSNHFDRLQTAWLARAKWNDTDLLRRPPPEPQPLGSEDQEALLDLIARQELGSNKWGKEVAFLDRDTSEHMEAERLLVTARTRCKETIRKEEVSKDNNTSDPNPAALTAAYVIQHCSQTPRGSLGSVGTPPAYSPKNHKARKGRQGAEQEEDDDPEDRHGEAAIGPAMHSWTALCTLLGGKELADGVDEEQKPLKAKDRYSAQLFIFGPTDVKRIEALREVFGLHAQTVLDCYNKALQAFPISDSRYWSLRNFADREAEMLRRKRARAATSERD
ncbi:hypothetical protein P7C70_g4662, partial [Phenoliferia sp. Uapishka_3]